MIGSFFNPDQSSILLTVSKKLYKKGPGPPERALIVGLREKYTENMPLPRINALEISSLALQKNKEAKNNGRRKFKWLEGWRNFN